MYAFILGWHHAERSRRKCWHVYSKKMVCFNYT